MREYESEEWGVGTVRVRSVECTDDLFDEDSQNFLLIQIEEQNQWNFQTKTSFRPI